jgi:hypothetical protein
VPTCSPGWTVAPVLVVLEDMHWADRSRATIAFLARNLRANRIARRHLPAAS